MRSALVLIVLLAFAIPSLAAAQTPPPRNAAQGPYLEGSLVNGIGQSCSSIIFNSPLLENQTGAAVAQELPGEDTPPHAGDRFYVRLLAGSVGDICGGGTSLLPEFVPPDGVFMAGGARDVLWRYTGTHSQLTSGGVTLGRGRFGGVTIVPSSKQGSEPQLWPLANSGGFLELYVPLVSARRLNGIGSRAPNCPQRDDGTAPCEEAGDHLQVAAQTSCPCTPGTLIPEVGLFASRPATPSLRVRKRRVRVRTAPLATVRGRLAGRRIKAKASRDGSAVLELPRGRHGRLKVTARTIDGAVSPAARVRI